MAKKTTISIAYCKQNEPIADRLIQTLSGTGIQFERLHCESANGEGNLNYQLSGANNPILFLLSDNLLKSVDCMQNLHATLQGLIQKGQLTTVVIEGTETQEDGSTISVPTQFDRVSHVIKYMNHWQDAYLSARKLQREIPKDQQDSFNERLKSIRGISSDIGELLRYLRNTDYYTLEQFTQDHFELFFSKFNLKHLYPSFKSTEIWDEPTTEPTPQPDSPSVTPIEVDVESEAGPASDSSQQDEDIPAVIDPEIEISSGEMEDHIEEVLEDALDTEEDPTNTEVLEDQADNLMDEIPKADSEDHEFAPSSDLVLTDDDEEEEENEADLASADSTESGDQAKDPSEETPVNQQPEQEDEDEDEEIDEDEDEDELEALFEEEEIEENPEEKIKRVAKSAFYLAQANEVAQGENLLSVLVKNNPDNAGIRYKYASYLMDYSKNQKRAEEELLQVIESEPLHVNSLLRLGELAELKGNFENALRYFDRAKEIKPKIKDLNYKLGVLTQMVNPEDIESALRYLKKAVKQDEENVDALYRYAILLSTNPDKKEKAINSLEKILEINPAHPFANYDLALLYHQNGHREQAWEYYERACTINPELKTPQNDLAFAIPEPEPTPEPEPEAAVIEAEPEEQTAPTLISSTEESEPAIAAEAGITDKSDSELPVVLITGATAGIGRATADIFARNGYPVILTGRRTDRLDELKTSFETAYQTQVETLPFDVRNIDEAKQALESLPDAFKQIDILINNAGLAKGLSPIHEGNLDHWETMIDTNIKGLLYMTRLVSPGMVDRQQGHIINVCSAAGQEVYPMGNVYCATKHAVDALTKSFRLDLTKYKIRVSQVSPGHVEETEFARVRFDGDEERAKIYEDFQPLKSADVAETIYFIATRPSHVNIQDVLLLSSQQANTNYIDRSGRS